MIIYENQSAIFQFEQFRLDKAAAAGALDCGGLPPLLRPIHKQASESGGKPPQSKVGASWQSYVNYEFNQKRARQQAGQTVELPAIIRSLTVAVLTVLLTAHCGLFTADCIAAPSRSRF